MLLQACKTYIVTVRNAMQGYPRPLQRGAFNSFRDPYITNLHTHGLHVSGDTGADDVSVEILPGQSYNYTYIIPCDHAGESCVLADLANCFTNCYCASPAQVHVAVRCMQRISVYATVVEVLRTC
jgi:hypothetical protein